MPAIVAIDAAGPMAGIAVLDAAGETRARRIIAGRPGLIETLPVALRDCLDEAKLELGAVAVTVGPGSFTGLRTAIALAQGYAAAAGLPLLAVTVAEAFDEAFPTLQRPLWVALRARRGRIYLLRGGEAAGFADADIPRTRGPVAVAGDAANDVVARLAAAGTDVLLTNARGLDPVWVARAALARLAAGLPAREALPFYVDPPEAKLPAGARLNRLITATGVHAEAMAAIHGAAFPEAPWPADSFAVLLGQPGVFGFIDVRGGMALLRVVADEAEILTIGVTERRQGVGRALMLAAMAQAREAGAAVMHLEVAAANTAARGLYAAMEFTPAGTRRAYYPDGGDALLLSRRL